MDMCGVVGFVVALIGIGPFVALTVQLLKRIKWVAENPLVVVAIINAGVALVKGITFCGLDLAAFLTQVAAGFSGAVAAYEVVKAAAKVGSQSAMRD